MAFVLFPEKTWPIVYKTLRVFYVMNMSFFYICWPWYNWKINDQLAEFFVGIRDESYPKRMVRIFLTFYGLFGFIDTQKYIVNLFLKFEDIAIFNYLAALGWAISTVQAHCLFVILVIYYLADVQF